MMRQDKQFDSLVIVEEEIEHLDKIIHYHNYYLFIYIKSGSGNHYLNGESTPFVGGNVFFISPRDQHSLEINTSSVIISVRFTEYAKGKLKALQKEWKGDFSGFKKGRSPLNIKIVFPEKDLQIADRLFSLLSVMKNDVISNEAIIYIQLIALVSLIERNLSYGNDAVEKLSPLSTQYKKAELLLSYINRHISKPEMLSAAKLATHSGISVHYIGLYFKQHNGMTVQAYINHCRQTIIARKLRSGEFTIAQLTADFGFTDASHFNKSFKKYWGMSASRYRLAYRESLINI